METKFTNTNDFIATYTDGLQISPDDWTTHSPTLKITQETTVGEIHNWFRKQNKVAPMEVKIIQLQELVVAKIEDV